MKPPAERDLPAAAAVRVRARVLAATRSSPPAAMSGRQARWRAAAEFVVPRRRRARWLAAAAEFVVPRRRRARWPAAAAEFVVPRWRKARWLAAAAESVVPRRRKARWPAAAAGPVVPHRRRARWLAAAVCAGVFAALMAVLTQGAPGRAPQVLAMGPDELSPQLREAAVECLRWNGTATLPLPVDPADLVVAASDGERVLLLYVNHTGYLGCSLQLGTGGGVDTDRWVDPATVPGPVQRLLLTSSEADGGVATATGRVSARVHRLVVEHGDGRSTAARIERGAFGVIADGVRADAQLVGYDAGGAEIYRRPLFSPRPEMTPQCRAVPPGPECPRPEPWGR